MKQTTTTGRAVGRGGAAKSAGDVTELLINAAGRNDNFTLEELIAGGADVNASRGRGWTAIMQAAGNGREENVKTLLAAGANPNAALPCGFTPLMAASDHNHAKVVRRLIAGGADVHAASEEGLTAVLLAGHRRAIVKLLADAGAESRTRLCGRCEGRGERDFYQCGDCHGKGREWTPEAARALLAAGIKIPPVIAKFATAAQ